METKRLSETASSGATSAGNIATVPALNFSVQRRLPPTVLFTTSTSSAKNVMKSGKKATTSAKKRS